MSGVFEALGEPVRRLILEILAAGEQPVGPLVTALQSRLPISQPAVSQHLAVLRRCGLVAHRREGRSAVYQARPEGLAPLTDWLTHYRTFWPERLAKLKNLLDQQTKAQSQGDKA